MKNLPYLCTRFQQKALLSGVMVALQILVLSVWVRVLAKQLTRLMMKIAVSFLFCVSEIFILSLQRCKLIFK